MAFAYGIHFCLGAWLARLEAQLSFDTLLRALAGSGAGAGRAALEADDLPARARVAADQLERRAAFRKESAMKAAVMRAIQTPLQIEEIEIDAPRPREVLVRTLAIGVCHSDLHVLDGALPNPLPIVLGHEPAGIVEAVGAEVRHVAPGDHVIGCLSAFCGDVRILRRRAPVPLRGRGDDARPRRAAAALEARRADPPVRPSERVRRAHARARERAGEDPRRHAARPRGADRLRRHHRARRGPQPRAGARRVARAAVIGCGGVGLAVIQGCRIAGAGRIIAVDAADVEARARAGGSARPMS